MIGVRAGHEDAEDARQLRNHILGAFEMADSATDPSVREGYLTFVVVGAGPTGVEVVGQIAELAHRVLPGDYRGIVAASPALPSRRFNREGTSER